MLVASIHLHVQNNYEFTISVRFVLYQMSKNLNRPFFMDFLTTLSVRYSDKAFCEDFTSDDEGTVIFTFLNSKYPFVYQQVTIS